MGIFQVPQDLNRETTFEDHAITDPKKQLQFLAIRSCSYLRERLF